MTDYKPKERKPDYPVDKDGVHRVKGEARGMRIRKTDWPRFVTHNYRAGL